MALPIKHNLKQNDKSKKNVKKLQKATTNKKKSVSNKILFRSLGTQKRSFTDKRYNLPRTHQSQTLCA